MQTQTPASSHVDEQKGPLSGIGDPAAQKEIGKLWSVIEARLGYQNKTASHVLVTRADLDLLKQSVASRLDNASPATVAAPQIIGGGSAAGASGSDLLTTNNTWTGSQAWGRKETFLTFPYQFAALNLGTALTAGGAPSLQENGYQTAVDIRKSSDAKAFATLGGNAALFVQHRINASVATSNATHVGVAVAVYSQQQNVTSGVNNAIAGFFSLNHNGTNVTGYAISATVFHIGAAGINVSHGVAVDLWRSSTSGYTVGFHARCNSAGSTYKDNNYAFLASTGPGNTRKFNTGFSLGSQFTGVLTCDVGLDMGWCNITTAAIIIPGNAPIVLNVPNSALVRYNTANNWFQFEAGGALQLVLTSTGNMAVAGSMTINAGCVVGGSFQSAGDALLQGAATVSGALSAATINLTGAPTVPSAGALLGYWQVGGLGKVPYYA